MNSEAVKNARTLLRRALEHIESSCERLNVERESIGFVDVILHPESAIPDLNYVTPRRNTAWIGSEAIVRGLDYLHERGRDPRFFYIEGLIPPQFSHTLTALNLIEGQRTPIMVYEASGDRGILLPHDSVPGGLKLEIPPRASTDGVTAWETIAQDGGYVMTALHLEPVAAGTALQQADLIVCDGSQILGIARVSLNAELRTAHVVATALHQRRQTATMARLLYTNVLRYAVDHGADMIFTSAPAGLNHFVLRELGAVKMGSAVFFADPTRSSAHKDTRTNERLANSLLSLYPTG